MDYPELTIEDGKIFQSNFFDTKCKKIINKRLNPDRLEITNYKHQITNKFQYSMTKTFTVVVSHRFANPVLPVMIPLGTTVNGLLVWNFEFGSLGIV